MNKMNKNRITRAIMATVMLSPCYGTALAEEQVKSGIEVVTVTAQKRVQNVLKVPVAVGTISAELVEESGAVLLSELDKFIPGSAI